MEEPVKATFWHMGGFIYRNKTKIIFNKGNGMEEKLPCIGIVLMSNPGSCLPKEGEECVLNLPERTEKEFSCNIDKDKTIKEYIPNCIIEAYNDYLPLQGYVFIVNLSDKRNPKSKELSEEDFNKKPDDIVKEIENKIKEQNNVKWIWIAFGKDSNGKNKETRLKLKEIKEKVSNQLNKLFPDKIVGKSVGYKHPYQRKRKEYDVYKENVVHEIKSKLYNS